MRSKVYAGVMKHALVSLAVVTALAAVAARGGDSALGGLRVLSTQTNCFEYKLMSAMGSDASRRLAFNGLGGTTHIVKVGEALGPYTVTGFQPTNERVFVASVNAWQTRAGGVATLADGSGATFRLPLGKPISTAGWMACLAELDGGGWRFVRPGDELAATGGVARVVEVTGNTVRIGQGGQTLTVPWATDEERDALTALWEERRQEMEQKPAVAAAAPAPVLPTVPPQPPPPPARRSVTVRSAPRVSLGGMDYSYPTEFEVISVPVRTSSGKMVYRPIAVPTRFTRRSTGMQFDAR